MAGRFGSAFVIFMKLLPAVVIFTLFFSFEGNLRWLGLLGFIPLALAFGKNGTACMTAPNQAPGKSGCRPAARR